MTRRSAILSLLIASSTVLGMATLASNLGAAPPRVPEAIAEAMQDRDFAKAITAINAAMEDPQAEQDQLLYLKGRAQHFLEQYDAALQTFELFNKLHPESPLARRVRFAKAVSLIRLGNYEQAEAIYRAESQYLLSSERKQQIAEIYLEFAEAYFDPPKEKRNEGQEPNYAKALEFFNKALEVGPAPAQRMDVEMRIGFSLQQLGKHAEAEQQYVRFLKDHPGSDHDLEARFRLGETRLATGKNAAARQTWEDLRASHADSDSDRLAQAAFQIGLTYYSTRAGQTQAGQQAGAPQANSPLGGDHNAAGLDLAISRHRAFLKQYPAHELASAAYREISIGQMRHRRYSDAATTISEYLKDKRYVERAETPMLRFQLGQCLLLQKKYDEAIKVWQEFLAKHPADRSWSNAQRQIVEAEYLKANERKVAKDFTAARQLYVAFLAKHPLDARAAQIAVTLGNLNAAQKKWEEALADWRRVVAKYPQTNEASFAQFLIGNTLERELKRHEDALKEYRKLNWGAHQARAQSQVARLLAKQLRIHTDRVFRTDETPRIRVVTRNLKELQVRAYRIDLETYFRKMHLARGVEQLDISLIDPDHSFVFKVPDYVEFAAATNEIDLKIDENDDAQKIDKQNGDVLVVTVSSDALEATTMVLQSDLDIVVKSSRDEVFVFAQNMRTGKPWPKASILVSNGENVFAEAETGDDGVYQGAFEELKATNDVRVFAVSGGNTASNVVDLDGVGVAQGLSNKGYVYTDRPAYRPGHFVNIRGVIRKVSADAYTIESGKAFDLLVQDSRGRQVWTEQVKLNEFGTFHARLRLPSAAATGEYRIQVSDKDKQTYNGAFVVQDYKLENVKLEIDTPRKVYYRGEVIKGTIRATYYYGSPVAAKEVRYELSDGSKHTGLTDQQGELSFEIDTREYYQQQQVGLVASLPELGLTLPTSFVIATQEYSLAVSTPRPNPVYLAGETFEVSVNALDAEGKPIATKLQLSVFQQTSVSGVIGERLVSEHAAETDEKDGNARVTLALKEAGTYFLRVSGEDRFDNIVTAQHQVTVSGDEDSVRLRLLAERHTFKVGETPKIRIHWREKPALAIATFQGARVLDYRLIELKTGINLLEAPMTPQLAPNFDLQVTVMTDARQLTPRPAGQQPVRLHEASSSFAVQRNLLVNIEPAVKGPARPGDELTVKITTTDPQGKPVAAEVSLAMVEQSLLDRFPDSMSSIDVFFRGNLRQSAIRTTSSISFSYQPQTRGGTLGMIVPIVGDFAVGDQPFTAALDSIEESSVPFDDRTPLQWAPQLGGYQAPDYQTPVAGTAQGRLGRYSGSGQRGQPNAAPSIRPQMDPRDLNLGSDKFALRESSRTLTQRFDKLKSDGYWGFRAAFPDGRIAQYELAFRQGGELEELAKRIQQQGGILLPGRGWEETGYWNPSLHTNDKGVAEVTFTIPERSTTWKLLSKGTTTATLTGQAESKLTAKKELFGELKLPLALTDGDRIEVLATVHNTAAERKAINVTLKTTIGGKTATQTRTIPPAPAEGPPVTTHPLTFAIDVARPEDAEQRQDVSAKFSLDVQSGEQKDTFVRVVAVRPNGLPVVAEATGTSSSDATAFVEFPTGLAPMDPQLKVTIGPSLQTSLLSMVQSTGSNVSPPAETVSSDLLAALALQALINQTRDAANPHAATIDRRIRSAIASLIAMQADDGGWSWCEGSSNRFASSRALWALGQAKRAGYSVPDDNVSKATTFLQSQVAKTDNSDYESKAVLLHALSVAEISDFPMANRLYRNRESLSNAALLYLSLALTEMNRESIAVELLDMVERRGIDDSGPSALPWNHSIVENRALYALALQITRPTDARANAAAQWLMEHRTGGAWVPAKASGPAAQAVCRWTQRNGQEQQAYKLKVLVNEQEVAELQIDGASELQSIRVPSKALKPGKQAIRFELTGRAQFSYQCTLEGYVPANKLVSSTDRWKIERIYEPAQMERDGRMIPRGFTTVQSLSGTFKPFRNPLTQLPIASKAHVTLNLRRNADANKATDQREFLSITESLPSGVTLVEGSVAGDFQRYEVHGNSITFFVGQKAMASIRYAVYGYLAGQYNTAPPIARDIYRAERYAVHKPHPLAVLALGKKSEDPYRLTPDELSALGTRAYQRSEWDECVQYLSDLAAGDWTLKSDTAKQATRMLLDAHLEIGPPQRVVSNFEIIKEKWPELEIPYAKILKIGSAYQSIGEFERAYLIFRATVESSFRTESRVAGFLESQDELLRSVKVMDQLLMQYPPEPYVADAEFDLAQSVYAMADRANGNAKLREQKVEHDDLVREAIDRLHNYLSYYPTDPGADKAAFSLATGHLELRQFQTAIDRCKRFVERYADSPDVDSFWYTIGYCQFALSMHDQALKTCQKVAEMKRRDPRTGLEAPAENRLQAIYILGQIYHSLGRAAEAIKQYTIVKDNFPDASEAISFFSRRDIELPEVTTIPPSKPVELALKYRNIATVEAKVYKIDLMKFGLQKRNLQGITNINLAGVRPFHEVTLKLGDGADYGDKQRTLKLPIKDEGAWLVVCRGDDLHASGLVLVSPLAVEIQEEPASGRVRTTVKDTLKDRYAPNIQVKVIGSDNTDFVSGETDLRGVFVADKIRGTSTIIAQAGPSRYAFFRGVQQLGPPPTPQEPAAPEQPNAAGDMEKKGQPGLLDNLYRRNFDIQQENLKRQDGQYFNDESGVKVDAVKP